MAQGPRRFALRAQTRKIWGLSCSSNYYCRLPIADCRLPIADCRLTTHDSRLPSHRKRASTSTCRRCIRIRKHRSPGIQTIFPVYFNARQVQYMGLIDINTLKLPPPQVDFVNDITWKTPSSVILQTRSLPYSLNPRWLKGSSTVLFISCL